MNLNWIKTKDELPKSNELVLFISCFSLHQGKFSRKKFKINGLDSASISSDEVYYWCIRTKDMAEQMPLIRKELEINKP